MTRYHTYDYYFLSSSNPVSNVAMHWLGARRWSGCCEHPGLAASAHPLSPHNSRGLHHLNAGSSLPSTVLMIFWEPLMDATRPPTLHQSSRSFPRLHTWSLKRSVPGGWRIEMHTWLFETAVSQRPVDPKKHLKLGRCHPTVGVDVGMPHLRFKPRRFLPSKTGGFTLQKVAKNVYWVYSMFFKAAKCWKFLQTEFLKVLQLSSLAVFHLAFQNIFADGTDASRAEVMETNSP